MTTTNQKTKQRFAKRMDRVPKSFLRELLNLTQQQDIISFAGGLPNPELFPIDAFKKAADKALSENGKKALQYSNSEGYLPLRQYICDQYKKKEGITVSPSEILITNGSQQGLDLLGKVLIDSGDVVMLEKPTYLAALQTLSLYGAEFKACELGESGPDIESIKDILLENKGNIKAFYTVPNFQNPTGITWSNSVRAEAVQALEGSGVILIEDDPYGEIRWRGERQGSMINLYEDTVLLGSFSKIVAPGLRLGWIYTKDAELYEKLYIAKQASDLHTSTFNQIVLNEYLLNGDNDTHIASIARHYSKQKDTMTKAIDEYLPGVTYTDPDGGMFLWVTFAKGVDTHKLFKKAVDNNVAFVPGFVFYADQDNAPKNTARFNFTNSSIEEIVEGIKRIAEVLAEL